MRSTTIPRAGGLAAGVVLALALAVGVAGEARGGSCEPLAPHSANVASYGIDYLPRVDFSAGGGEASACAHALPASLPAPLAVPLYAYNLQGEAEAVRFRVLATVEITGFTPGPGLDAEASTPNSGGDGWVLDVRLSAAGLCGPALLGEVVLAVPAGCLGLTVDVAGHGGEPAPVVTTAGRGELPAVTPRHGAYAGAPDVYHCQQPLCREPHTAVTGFQPVQQGGAIIELAWTAGSGEYTMIRQRKDGVAPTSIFDGKLLAVVPTTPGHAYTILHEHPEAIQYWYTAFSVSMSGDMVTLGSSLECGSFTTASVDPSIPTDPVTWGAVKNAYR